MKSTGLKNVVDRVQQLPRKKKVIKKKKKAEIVLDTLTVQEWRHHNDRTAKTTNRLVEEEERRRKEILPEKNLEEAVGGIPEVKEEDNNQKIEYEPSGLTNEYGLASYGTLKYEDLGKKDKLIAAPGMISMFDPAEEYESMREVVESQQVKKFEESKKLEEEAARGYKPKKTRR